jgi:hypothetical protein
MGQWHTVLMLFFIESNSNFPIDGDDSSTASKGNKNKKVKIRPCAAGEFLRLCGFAALR